MIDLVDSPFEFLGPHNGCDLVIYSFWLLTLTLAELIRGYNCSCVKLLDGAHENLTGPTNAALLK